MRRRKSKSKHGNPEKDNETQTVASSSSAPPPSWIELPRDITANILLRLGAFEILKSAQQVCTAWRRVCKDPAMWRVIDMKEAVDMDYEEFDFWFSRAVDLSQGQLIDLSIDYYGYDELLNKIVDRSSHLRRLQLYSCEEPLTTAVGLSEAVKKLPHLEALHLTIMSWVLPSDVETLGVSCPTLKSFAFNQGGSNDPIPEEHPDIDNGYALAIARTMPNLRHLQLFADCLSNEGLEAILDGCPHLESLDLRQCFNLDLSGCLGERCYDMIKDLRCPVVPFSDIWWFDDGPSIDWGDSSDYGFPYGSFCSFEYYDHSECCGDYTAGLGYDDDETTFFDGDDDF